MAELVLSAAARDVMGSSARRGTAAHVEAPGAAGEAGHQGVVHLLHASRSRQRELLSRSWGCA